MQINYLICIFINTDENFRKKGKLKKNALYKLNSAPKCPCCMLLSSVIQFDKSFYTIVIYKSHLHIHEYL